MGMSTRIKAYVPDTDREYQKHKEVYLVCLKAGVSLPKETEEYFKGCDRPEEKLEVELVKGEHYQIYRQDMNDGFEVELDKLPEGVTKIRFYNSY